MAKKVTHGWAIKTISGGGVERWHYVGSTGQLYKTRAGAENKMLRLGKWLGQAELYRVNMFYEPDNET